MTSVFTFLQLKHLGRLQLFLAQQTRCTTDFCISAHTHRHTHVNVMSGVSGMDSHGFLRMQTLLFVDLSCWGSWGQQVTMPTASCDPSRPVRDTTAESSVAAQPWFLVLVGLAQQEGTSLSSNLSVADVLFYLTKCCLTGDSEQNLAAIQSAQMNLSSFCLLCRRFCSFSVYLYNLSVSREYLHLDWRQTCTAGPAEIQTLTAPDVAACFSQSDLSHLSHFVRILTF